jgi:hypothetical protein
VGRRGKADLSIWIDLETGLLDVEGGYIGNIVVLALAFFFLQLVRDATNGSLLDAAHQVGGEARDFISKTLWGDDGLCNGMSIPPSRRVVVEIAHHLIDDPLIGMEIIGEAGVALES